MGNDKPGSAKAHPFFKGFDWDALYNGTMKSPFEGVRLDESMAGGPGNPTNDESNEEKNNFFRNAQIQKLFADYFFDIERVRVDQKLENGEEEKKNNGVEGATGSTGITKFTTVVTHLN